MDAFLSQIQPYLDQAQIAAIQVYEAALANPTETAAFAAVFLLLMFLRRRRLRIEKAQSIAREQRKTEAAAAEAAPAVETVEAVEEVEEAPEPVQQDPREAEAPTAAPAAEGTREAPLVLKESAKAKAPLTPNKVVRRPAVKTQAAGAARPVKRAATGPKLVHILRRITRANDAGFEVKRNVALSKILTDTSELSPRDLNKTVDYGIFSPEGKLVAAIEDHTETPKGSEPARDAEKREILRKAGIPVTELLAGFTEAQLSTHLNKLMGST